jgi:Skp family chaperone for outer membrane proteins
LEIPYVSQLATPIRRVARIAAAAAFCALAAAPAFAQQTQPQPDVPTFQTQPQPQQPVQGQGTINAAQIPIVLGVLDTSAILNTSSAGKALNNQWNAALKALNDDMAKKEDGLRAQAQQLETARSGNPPMTPADFAAKRKQLEQLDAQYQQAYAKNKQTLDTRLNKARDTIAISARKAMQDVAKARGLTLILDRVAVPYSPQPWNVTDDVLARLNKALPSVKL